ncbi:MAG: S9 family peptidase [Aestuariibacter sp.]
MQSRLSHHFTVLLYFLLQCSFTTAFAAEPNLTLEQLITLKEVSYTRISPDGRKIAYLVSVPRQPYSDKSGPDYQELFIVERGGKVRPFMTGPNHIKQLQWSADGKQLWLLVKRAYQPNFAIYVFNVAGGEAHKIVSRVGHIQGFSLNQDGNKLLFWHPAFPDENALQYQMQGFNATVEEEQLLNNQLWMIDFTAPKNAPIQLPFEQHVMHASFMADDRILLKSAPDYLVDSQVMRAELSVIDLQGKVLRRVAHQGKMGRAKASPDGETIVFLGSADTSSPDHGVLLVADKTESEPRVLLPDFEGFVTDFAFLSEQQLVFIADKGTDSILARKSVSSSSNGYRTIINNKLIFTSLDSQASRKSAAVIAHQAKHPAELFWLKGETLLRITEHNPMLGDITLPKQKSISFKAQDGLTLHGVLVSPADMPEDTPAPTIIFVHGGPESHVSDGWLGYYSHPVQVLANMGMRCFFPNYRGSSGRGSDFLKLGQQDYAGLEFDDIVAAKMFLVKEGLAIPNKVGIAGVSYGGYAAAWGATKHSEHFRAAVMLSGISNNISKFGTTDIPSEMIQTHALKMPWDSWQFLLSRSPVFYSEQHQTPLLIAHGLKDTRVHVSQSMELYRHLKTRGKAPVRFVTYPEQGHGNKDSHSQLDYSWRLIRWFEHFLLNEQTGMPPAKVPYPPLEKSH